MELLVNPASYSNALELISLGVHQICVGTKEFSLRNNCLLTIKQIEELIKNKKQTKILVLINRLYFDPELDALTEFILEISKLKIDGIIFSDFAVNQICFENNAHVNLIYNPETLVTNYGQFNFYLENNISEVALARELNVNQIKEIGVNKGDMKIQLQVSGHALMMHSRWNLLSNYQATQKDCTDITHQQALIREISRQEPSIIYEDEYGTYVLTNYDLSLFDRLSELKEMHVDTIRIDSFLHDEDWVTKTAKWFLKGITASDNADYNQYQNDFKQFKLSHGFYNMDKQDLVYLLKEDTYE